MDLSIILLLIAGLLIVVGLIQPLAARLWLSPSVLLAVVGVAIGAASTLLTRSETFTTFAGIAKVIVNLPIHSDAFLYIFLPMLLFESALNIDVHRMVEDAAPILLLAIVAVLVATLVIGAALGPIAGVSIVACFMLGSIVATTDPVAVIAIFRDVGAPARLSRLVEGESLLNDAAAITLFVLLLDILTGGHKAHIGEAALIFVRNFAGGIATGYVGARLIVWMLRWLLDLRLAQVTLTLALPYAVYIIGERQLGVSGVVATVTAGLVMSAIGQPRIAPDDWRFLHDVWEQLAFWASSLVFILAALLVPRMLLSVGWHDVLLLFVLVIAALSARALVLFGMFPVLTALRLSQNVNHRYKTVIVWGGLRGAVTLALALAVTENTRIGSDVQRFVGVLATGFVLFTLLINGTTLRVLIRILGLDRLSALDQALRDQVLALSRDRVSDTVNAIANEYKFPDYLISSVTRRHAAPDGATDGVIATSAREIGTEDYQLLLGLVALASHERDLVLKHFADRTVSGRIVEELLAAVGVLIDRTRTGGPPEYIRAAQQIIDFSRRFRLAHFFHRRFSLDGPLMDCLADRFELLLVARIVLQELEPYVNRKLAPLLDKHVTATVWEVLSQRHDMTATAVDALRQQYPAYAELLERRFLEKIWLRREEMEYRTLFEDGVIGPELYSVLCREMPAMRAKVEMRPRLDLGLETRVLLSRVPMFAALTQDQLDAVARLLRPRIAVPGEKLIRNGDVADAMYFLSSGSVEVRVVGQNIKLSAGDFFGEMALLTRQRRRGNVDALSYCQLLVLKDADFNNLLRSNPQIQAQIDAVVNMRIQMNEHASGKKAV
ncbi:MAG: cation:proton antiporter [Candidatus Binataceae bacterium]